MALPKTGKKGRKQTPPTFQMRLSNLGDGIKHVCYKVVKWIWDKIFLVCIVVLICFFLFMIIELEYPSREGSAGLVAVISAVIGVLLTASVTSFLLRNQAENEEQKDVNIRVFTKKMEVYHQFLSHLEQMIETKSFTESDMKRLLMQLSGVSMHADPKNVTEVYQHVQGLIDVLTAERDDTGLVENRDSSYYESLSESVFEIVRALRADLYGEDAPNAVQIESFNSLIERIEDVKELPPVRELVTNLNASKFVKSFHEALERELMQRLVGPADQWIFRANDGQNIDFRFRHSAWTGGNDYVGLMFDGIAASEVYFFVSVDSADPHKCYRYMRGVWGGRFNEQMWRMPIDAPYRNWRFDEAGLAAVSACDPALIAYLAGNLARFAEFTYYYSFISRLEQAVPLPKEYECHRWIYQNICLVHEWDEHDLVIDTLIEDNGWTIKLFSRSGSMTDVLRILPQSECPDHSGYRIRYFRSETLDCLPEVADKCRELLLRVEKYVAKQNQPTSKR